MPGLGLPAPPWIVGHRGVRGGEAPENTIASLREAVAQRADMVELDLQLTRDGALIAHHDRAVRLSAEETRPVGRATLEQIRRWPPDGAADPARRIPTLEEILVAAPRRLPLNLELKRYEPDADPGPLIEALARAIAGRGRVLVSSFDWPTLARVRGRLPEVPVAPLGGPAARWDELLAVARGLDAFAIHLERELAADLGRRGRLARASAAERPILAYTVNPGGRARWLHEAGVSGFFTDRPADLRAELRRR